VKFGTWNVRSLYRSSSLTAAARELSRNTLVLLGVQEVLGGKKGHCGSIGLYFLPWKKEQPSIGKRNVVQNRIV
jgi:hypothetical protein